jgi:hypothetical protein
MGPCIGSVCVGGVVCCVCETVDVDKVLETVDCANAVPAYNTVAARATVARLIIGDASIVCLILICSINLTRTERA